MYFLKNVASSIFGSLVGMRNELYEKGYLSIYKGPLPVISVGNITAGGNGKTPLVAFLVRELRHKGLLPCVVSRGYGGTERGPRIVKPTDAPSLVGDEPVMLSIEAECPVIISRKRKAGIELIAREKLGNIVVLDDGFQHRAVDRDIDIVTIDVSSQRRVNEFIEGKLLPKGLFREEREQALRRADLIVLSERKVARSAEELSVVDQRLLDLMPGGMPLFRSYLEFTGLKSLDGSPAHIEEPVVVLSAIAAPEGFRSSVISSGRAVLEHIAYPDHHAFTQAELHSIAAKYGEKVPIICTAKDSVKLRGLDTSSVRIFVFETRPQITPADAFMVTIMRGLKGRQSAPQ